MTFIVYSYFADRSDFQVYPITAGTSSHQLFAAYHVERFADSIGRNAGRIVTKARTAEELATVSAELASQFADCKL